jgi:D-aspartate ligase
LEDYSIPALVFGVGVTLTGVLRTLGQAGVRVYAVCDRADIATRSRWYEPPPGGDTSTVTPASLPAFLENCGLSRAVLIPCSDDWARAVASLPSSLTDRFQSSGPSSDVVDTMVDKWKFARLLDQAGVPHPQTRLLDSAEAMQHLPDSAFRGAFLKPLSSAEFAKRHGVKGFTVESRAEAISLLSVLDLPVMLQEYIPGPPTSHYFVEGFRDRTGKIRGLLARQRLRMFPLDLGNSSLMVSVSLDDVAPAVAALTRLLERVGYRGVFSAEFKRDARDDQFKILEVNARPWWYVEFAARCGVDVCPMTYRDALGLPVETVTEYQVGRRCMMFAIDMLAFYALRQKKNALSLGDWMESLRNADDALFSARDPLPALAHWGKLLRQRMLPTSAYGPTVAALRLPNKSVDTANHAPEPLAQAGPVRRA